MKYMLLIHEAAGTRELFSSEAGAELMAQVEAIMQELSEWGEARRGRGARRPLAVADGARAGAVQRVTTDTLREVKDGFGGYLIVRVRRASSARTSIAERWPRARAARSRCGR